MHLFDRSDDPAQASPAAAWGPASPPRGDRAGQLVSLLEMVGAAELSLADVLRHLVEEAAAELLAGVGVVAAVRRPDSRREQVATTGPAHRADELQLGLREGPVFDCLSERHPVTSADLTRDPRWPRLARSVGELADGARSAVCVPLPLDGLGSGTLSAYATDENADDEQQTAALLLRLATAAGPAVADVLVLDQARRLTVQLHLPGSDRRAVDEAIGVLMGQNGVGREEALAVLQTLGRTEHEDLGSVARAVVAARVAERGRPF